MNILFQNMIYYLWLHYVKKFDLHNQTGKIDDALNSLKLITLSNRFNWLRQKQLTTKEGMKKSSI